MDHHAHRVALIDDDASFRKATERLLRAYGWEARCFESANAFLDGGKDEEYNCLLVDLHMPRLSGCELLQRLREEGNDTPCIIITANRLNQSQRHIAEKFAKDVLSKPSEANELISALERACA